MINYSSPLCSTGYGVSGYNILKSLIKLHQDVRIFPILPADPEMLTELNSLYFGVNPTKLDNSPSVRIYHQYDVHPRVGKGLHAGFPIFELDNFFQYELSSMELCDILITCSKWGANILEKFFPNKNISVVPLGVNRSIFKEVPQSKLKPTIFLNVGKWEFRKGHDFIIECFRAAFTPKDNVELWMMCDNQFLKPEQVKFWTNLYMHPKVKLIPKAKTHENVAYIMGQADIGIFPARAEGWNLELLEMMSMGKHVICTNYSGHTEFANELNAKLINCSNMTKAIDNIWFHGNGSWLDLGQDQFDQTINHMKNLHNAKQDGNLGVNINGILTSEKFSWENSARKLCQVLIG